MNRWQTSEWGNRWHIVLSFCVVSCFGVLRIQGICKSPRAECTHIMCSFPRPSLYQAHDWGQCTRVCFYISACWYVGFIFQDLQEHNPGDHYQGCQLPGSPSEPFSSLWSHPERWPHAPSPLPCQKSLLGRSIIYAMSGVGEFSWASLCLWFAWKEGLLSFLLPIEGFLGLFRNMGMLSGFEWPFAVVMKKRIHDWFSCTQSLVSSNANCFLSKKLSLISTHIHHWHLCMSWATSCSHL